MAHPNEMFFQAKKSCKERFYPIIDNIVENLLGHAILEVDASKLQFARLLKVTVDNAARSIEEILDSIILDVINFHGKRTFVSIVNETNPESMVLNDGLSDLVDVKIEPQNRVTLINKTNSLASSIMDFGRSTTSPPPAQQISVTSPLGQKRQMEQSNEDNSNKQARLSSLEPLISEQEAMFVCHLNDCDAAPFADRKELLAHYRTHNEFQCGSCDKSYKRVDGFEKHYARVHSEVRSFSCQHCIRTFAIQRDLNNHERAHSLVGSYRCTFCGLQFRKYHPASRHVKSCLDIYLPDQVQNDIEQYIEKKN